MAPWFNQHTSTKQLAKKGVKKCFPTFHTLAILPAPIHAGHAKIEQ
jgi:hypothetical protein